MQQAWLTQMFLFPRKRDIQSLQPCKHDKCTFNMHESIDHNSHQLGKMHNHANVDVTLMLLICSCCKLISSAQNSFSWKHFFTLQQSYFFANTRTWFLILLLKFSEAFSLLIQKLGRLCANDDFLIQFQAIDITCLLCIRRIILSVDTIG